MVPSESKETRNGGGNVSTDISLHERRSVECYTSKLRICIFCQDKKGAGECHKIGNFSKDADNFQNQLKRGFVTKYNVEMYSNALRERSQSFSLYEQFHFDLYNSSAIFFNWLMFVSILLYHLCFNNIIIRARCDIRSIQGPLQIY